jgi:hypothetical protein
MTKEIMIDPAVDAAALAAYPPLLRDVLSNMEFGPLIRSPDRAKHRDEWRQFFSDLTHLPPVSKKLADRFHTKWHVSHHFVRELVEDDGLLLDLLWVWLPRYQGGDLVLYRGENIDRFEAGIVGSAWTDKPETADMFAGGLNAVGKGGVVLQAKVQASAIIAGPSWHSSQWLHENEFTVDIRQLSDIDVIACYPKYE